MSVIGVPKYVRENIKKMHTNLEEKGMTVEELVKLLDKAKTEEERVEIFEKYCPDVVVLY